MPIDDGFKRTIDDALTNSDWDQYDKVIQTETNEYNTRFASSPGFGRLDWTLFKAVVWVESGGPQKWVNKAFTPNPTWTTRPMQIGNPGDQGYPTLTRRLETSEIVMSDSLKLQLGQALTNPEVNIRAGMAYLLTRLTTSAIQTVMDPKDTAVYECTAGPGEGFWQIAKRLGTTTEDVLKKMNPKAGVLQKGQKLQYQKAALKRVITGWMAATPDTVARRYNVGDPDYSEKLTYALGVIGKIKR